MIDTTKSLHWIKAIEGYETGGNCPVDFIHLHDGRVIGIDNECIVLYESMEAFEEFDNYEAPFITLSRG
jgi:hypothetical protein